MDKFVVRKKRKCEDEKFSEKPEDGQKEKRQASAFGTTFYTNSGCGHQVNSGVKLAKVYVKVRRQKLAKQGPDPVSGLFNGVRVYINGETSFDSEAVLRILAPHLEARADETYNLWLVSKGYVGTDDRDLRHLIVQHGGTVAMGLALRSVTHLICTNLCDKKIDTLLKGKISSVKVVRPEWIFDSIREGKKLPEINYRVISDSVSELYVAHASSETRTIKDTPLQRQRLLDDFAVERPA
ncbi:deoxycytidyl transferase [Geranomyces michiganensis]|nr:deoxycytidyl transferase [Geranomyces michiganensis]